MPPLSGDQSAPGGGGEEGEGEGEGRGGEGGGVFRGSSELPPLL